MLVSGEAGIGTSSVVRAFTAGLRGSARVLAGACDDLLTPRSLGPFHDMADRAGPDVVAALAAMDREGLLSALGGLLGGDPAPTLEATACVNLASDLVLVDQHAEAASWTERGLAAARRARRRDLESLCLMYQATSEGWLGDPDGEAELRAAIERAEALGAWDRWSSRGCPWRCSAGCSAGAAIRGRPRCWPERRRPSPASTTPSVC